MKSKTLFTVLCIGMILPVCGMACPLQDLDRVNDIVNQARSLADGLRGTGAQTAQQAGQQTYSNPFANLRNQGVGAGVGLQAANGSAVEVGPNQVRINAAGMDIAIPRVGGVNTNLRPVPGVGITGARPADALEQAAFYTAFADATRAFRNADYPSAITKMETASKAKLANFDQFNSLCQFAVANYPKSAEYAYAALARNQVWEWRQLRANYGNPDFYSQQYLALQKAAQQPNADVSTWFLLGYHHLMLGHRDHAKAVLTVVQNKLPNDPVTRNLLELCKQAPPMPMATR